MVLGIIGFILYLLAAVPVIYFLLFAIAARIQKEDMAIAVPGNRRFVILIPAYKADAVIVQTARAAASQDYPAELYSVLVISDKMKPETEDTLRRIGGVDVLTVHFEHSTKALSLTEAMNHLGKGAADAVAVVDCDNIVSPTFLRSMNERLSEGTGAVQAHRAAKNTDSSTAMVDAVSEEINNTIFRKGHVALGLPSALIGSGMAFHYEWFRTHIACCNTAGEDKELEVMLLEEGLDIAYAENEIVLDEKTRTTDGYYTQRRRWISAQFHSLLDTIGRLPKAKNRRGFADKMLQWCFLPRMVIIGLILFMVLFTSLFIKAAAFKWWMLLIMLCASMYLATPKDMMDRRLLNAIVEIPRLALLSLFNLFRMKGTKNEFYHTEHK